MGLTNYNTRTSKTTDRGTKITTSKSDDGTYTTKVYHDSDGKLVKGAVYNGDLNGDHTHYDYGSGYARGVLRSDVFK